MKFRSTLRYRIDLYDNDLHPIRQDVWGCGFSDEET